MRLKPNPHLRSELGKILPKLHLAYDEKEKLHVAPFGSPGYHTTLKGGLVHRTRESLHYAVALLDSGDEELVPRACGILDKVIGLQDTDPANATYGIWSWFYEEPLSKMAPPDWNWADFCGVQLLQAHEHHSRLPDELNQKIEASLHHAAKAIRKRDVGPGYTNICLMGGYLTLVAGERFGWDEFISYGRARLLRFAEHTKNIDGFTEFNSPTYTMVAIAEIGRVLAHAKDAEVVEKMGPVYRRAWEEVARHFHAPTGQWSGAQSRAYRNLLDPETRTFLSRSVGGFSGSWDPSGEEAAHLSAEFARLDLPCPADLVACFKGKGLSRNETRVVEKSADGKKEVTTSFYSDESIALGTVSRRIFWNQSRVLLAHWRGQSGPAYLQLRFLHDGYDFCSAHFESAMEKNRVLGVLSMIRGGDTHPNLDMVKEGTIRARDLRLSFEFGGDIKDLPGTAPLFDGKPFEIYLGEWRLSLPEVIAGSVEPRWEIRTNPDPSRPEAKGSLDLIFYQGPEKEFGPSDWLSLSAAFYFQFLKKGDSAASQPEKISATPEGISLSWGDLKLTHARHLSDAEVLSSGPKVR